MGKTKILVLCDDVWHPAEVIKRGMMPLAGDDFHFDFVEDAKDILTKEMIREVPLIINCKGNQLTGGNPASWFERGVTEVMAEEFREYVEEGGAFFSLHAGNSFRGEEEYAELIGNEFVKHPPRCEIELRKVADHPVMEGVAPVFYIRDEHYEIELRAEDAQIFLRSRSETGGDQIAGYTRFLGKGKICVLTPGHILAVWQNPDFMKMVQNAIRWCLV